LRGGSWNNSASDLQSSLRLNFRPPASEYIGIGFRVATVPEPSTLLLGALGMIGLLWWNKRRK